MEQWANALFSHCYDATPRVESSEPSYSSSFFELVVHYYEASAGAKEPRVANRILREEVDASEKAGAARRRGRTNYVSKEECCR